ncbi:MAG: GYD domain-containing protein [Deltaproteobacteria bacterium]|nr:GYD domain-containing protein [Deltaproteobacteria bacterium]NNK85476.1 GYD domain-containing protein [Desulfobacterales bacterium]
MPKYLISGSYVGEGIKGLLNDGGTKRKEAVEQLMESLGGSCESIHFAFGDDDFFIIANAPDNVKAAAGSLIASSTGAVSVKITVLLTPEELDEVSQISAPYRAPGQ